MPVPIADQTSNERQCRIRKDNKSNSRAEQKPATDCPRGSILFAIVLSHRNILLP